MRTKTVIVVALLMVGGISTSHAASLKDQLKAETASVGMHPGMDPGMYVCAANHLHIKGMVENTAKVAVGRVKLAGKAFGADGKLLGTATTSTKEAVLAPGAKAEFNLEFLTVTGPAIERVKKHEVLVVDAAPLKKTSAK